MSAVDQEALDRAAKKVAERFVTARNNTRQVSTQDQLTGEMIERLTITLATEVEYALAEGRLKSLALTHLEEFLTWANKSIYTQGVVEHDATVSDSGSARPIPPEGTSLA